MAGRVDCVNTSAISSSGVYPLPRDVALTIHYHRTVDLCAKAMQIPSPMAVRMDDPVQLRLLQDLCLEPLDASFWPELAQEYVHNDSRQYLTKVGHGNEMPRWATSYWALSPQCYYGMWHAPGKTAVAC